MKIVCMATQEKRCFVSKNLFIIWNECVMITYYYGAEVFGGLG